MEEIYVSDPLADKLIEKYEYYFEDVGTGVVFHVPNDPEGRKFKRMVEKLEKTTKWKKIKHERDGNVFERTGVCPTCGITISHFEENGCNIPNFPIELCYGTDLD